MEPIQKPCTSKDLPEDVVPSSEKNERVHQILTEAQHIHELYVRDLREHYLNYILEDEALLKQKQAHLQDLQNINNQLRDHIVNLRNLTKNGNGDLDRDLQNVVRSTRAELDSDVHDLRMYALRRQLHNLQIERIELEELLRRENGEPYVGALGVVCQYERPPVADEGQSSSSSN